MEKEDRQKKVSLILRTVFRVLEPADEALVTYDRILARLCSPGQSGLSNLYRRAVDATDEADDVSLQTAFDFCVTRNALDRWEPIPKN